VAKISGSQTADRALHVLDILTDFTTAPRLSDLSEAVGLNISTTSRLLATLEQRGYVRRDPTDNRYRLGYKLLYMANVVQEQASLHQLADDVLQRLVDDVGETSGLSILDQDQVLVVARVTCQNVLRVMLPVGSRFPAYCTAAGKVLLAYRPPEQVERILDRGMPSLTDLTITDPIVMRDELARIRECGYSVDLGEREPGLIGIGVPVRRASGDVVGVCTTSGSEIRITRERIPVIVERVRHAAEEISTRLGWRPTGTVAGGTGTRSLDSAASD
jgi:IclR family acetate operon transcriptional repressor